MTARRPARKIDASAFTGILSVTGTGFADIILGGTKADVLNGGAGKDTISGGAGDDVITVNTAAQADQITLGDGKDVVKFSGANLAATLATSAGTTDVVRITDFVAGTDKIGLVDAGWSVHVDRSLERPDDCFGCQPDCCLCWYHGDLQHPRAALRQAVLSSRVTAGASAGTYLYVNDATAGVSNANDLLVNITGLTGTLAATDFVFA